jgi:hypothetical protein
MRNEIKVLDSAVNIGTEGNHDVLNDPDLNYTLQGVFDEPFNV